MFRFLLLFLIGNLSVYCSHDNLQESEDFVIARKMNVSHSMEAISQNTWSCKRLVSAGWTSLLLLLGSSIDAANANDVRANYIFNAEENAQGLIPRLDIDICGDAYALTGGNNLWMFKMRNTDSWVWVPMSPITKYGFELQGESDREVPFLKDYGKRVLIYKYNVIETPECKFKYRIINTAGSVLDANQVKCTVKSTGHSIVDRSQIENVRPESEGGLLNPVNSVISVSADLEWEYACHIIEEGGKKSLPRNVIKGSKSKDIFAEHYGFCIDDRSVQQVVKLYTYAEEECGRVELGEIVLRTKNFQIKKERIWIFWTREYFDPAKAYITWERKISKNPSCTEVKDGEIAVCEDGMPNGRVLSTCSEINKQKNEKKINEL